jgi:hypothetical protein
MYKRSIHEKESKSVFQALETAHSENMEVRKQKHKV